MDIHGIFYRHTYIDWCFRYVLFVLKIMRAMSIMAINVLVPHCLQLYEAFVRKNIIYLFIQSNHWLI